MDYWPATRNSSQISIIFLSSQEEENGVRDDHNWQWNDKNGLMMRLIPSSWLRHGFSFVDAIFLDLHSLYPHVQSNFLSSKISWLWIKWNESSKPRASGFWIMCQETRLRLHMKSNAEKEESESKNHWRTRWYSKFVIVHLDAWESHLNSSNDLTSYIQ